MAFLDLPYSILHSRRHISGVGGGAKRRYPPFGMMSIAESILSYAEGLHPSYVGITTQQAAANLPQEIEQWENEGARLFTGKPEEPTFLGVV